MKVYNKNSLEDIRKELRADMTTAEKILWQQLRNNKLNGLKFKRQHSIGNYIVDFYCYSLRLVIELDGKVHLGKEQKEKDKYRDEVLSAMNYKVLRIKNEEVMDNLNKVLEKIKNIPRRNSIY